MGARKHVQSQFRCEGVVFVFLAVAHSIDFTSLVGLPCGSTTIEDEKQLTLLKLAITVELDALPEFTSIFEDLGLV
jgi:hypothetical protein